MLAFRHMRPHVAARQCLALESECTFSLRLACCVVSINSFCWVAAACSNTAARRGGRFRHPRRRESVRNGDGCPLLVVASRLVVVTGLGWLLVAPANGGRAWLQPLVSLRRARLLGSVSAGAPETERANSVFSWSVGFPAWQGGLKGRGTRRGGARKGRGGQESLSSPGRRGRTRRGGRGKGDTYGVDKGGKGWSARADT